MLALFPVVFVLVAAALVSAPAEAPFPGVLGAVALPEGSDGDIWFELFPQPASRSVAVMNKINFFMVQFLC